MYPLVGPELVWYGNLLQSLNLVHDDKPQTVLAQCPNAQIVTAAPIVEDSIPTGATQTFPFHPGLDGGLGQIVENIRRQFEVTACAVQEEDVVGRAGW